MGDEIFQLLRDIEEFLQTITDPPDTFIVEGPHYVATRGRELAGRVAEVLRPMPKNDAETLREYCNQCYRGRGCIHRATVPGNTHIQCKKPDRSMVGDPHGIAEGWFYYPLLFDPVWMRSKCNNYEEAPDGQK